MPAHRLWMKSGASGRAIKSDESAVDLTVPPESASHTLTTLPQKAEKE